MVTVTDSSVFLIGFELNGLVWGMTYKSQVQIEPLGLHMPFSYPP